MEVKNYIEGIREIIDQGGPSPSEYEFLKNVPPNMYNISLEEQHKVYQIISPILTTETMIGFTFKKPHGYAGDYELIDRIYNKRKTDKESLQKWDSFYHDLEAATAVRNRKQYFKELIDNTVDKHADPLVLNLGSGPCSDLYEYLIARPYNAKVRFECLDMDINAIEYGSSVCDNYYERVRFIQKNAFRYKPDYQYELIWSAGLFDYFNDKLFIRLLNRMYALVKKGGELVIGNFSDYNPSKDVMEVFGQWYLHHRNEDQLIKLALSAGIERKLINVSNEQEKVNLFLHVKK